MEERGMEPDTAVDWRRDRIGAALGGENPTVLARLPSADRLSR